MHGRWMDDRVLPPSTVHRLSRVASNWAKALPFYFKHVMMTTAYAPSHSPAFCFHTLPVDFGHRRRLLSKQAVIGNAGGADLPGFSSIGPDIVHGLWRSGRTGRLSKPRRRLRGQIPCHSGGRDPGSGPG